MKTKNTLLKNAFIIGISLLSTSMYSQSQMKQSFNSNPLKDQTILADYSTNLDKIVSAYRVETIDHNAIYSFAQKQVANANFTLNTGGHQWDLNLTRVDLRSDDYRFIVITDHGNEVYPRTQAVTYRGFANGKEDNTVFATICEDFVTFTINEDNKIYQVEPVSWKSAGAATNDYITYNESDFKIRLNCATPIAEAQTPISQNVSTTAACVGFNAVLYGITSLTNAKGGKTATESYLNSIFNSVQSNYMSAHNIQLKLSGVLASTSAANDPVSSTSHSTYIANCNTWGASTKFTSLGFASNLVGVVGSFGSNGIEGVGGEANPSSVCNTSKKFMWSSDLTPAYTMAHEWGHMFGCGHDN
ncbi:MAG: hypothetical protein H0W84_13630, partial [Bacteroidetes bacterium]|nr:hypothetical protein [Bacteroidota bacterium]